MNCSTYDNGQVLGTVEGKIHAIVKTLQKVDEDGNSDIEYLYCNWAQANVALDKVDKPTIVYVLPPSGALGASFTRDQEKFNVPDGGST